MQDQSYTSPDDELLTQDEAAKELKTKPQTLAAWRSRGNPEIPFIRVGRLVRYRRSDLKNFLRSNTHTIA